MLVRGDIRCDCERHGTLHVIENRSTTVEGRAIASSTGDHGRMDAARECATLRWSLQISTPHIPGLDPVRRSTGAVGMTLTNLEHIDDAQHRPNTNRYHLRSSHLRRVSEAPAPNGPKRFKVIIWKKETLKCAASWVRSCARCLHVGIPVSNLGRPHNKHGVAYRLLEPQGRQ